jgi:N-carbamoyl-L-amino-acid hydrolase
VTLSGQAGGQAEAQALPGWRDSVAFAADVFEQLRAQTKGEDGIQRPSYGAGEDAAHALMGRLGISLGMEHSIDDAGNLHLTLAGAQREQDRWITGSHLDAVPDGGNFDGAAGVVAGLAVVHALRAAGRTLQRDLTVIGFRAEEGSSWFRGQHKSHFGSRALLGQLGAAEMREALSVVDGRTLWEHIERAGFRPDRIKTGLTHLQTARVHAFVELHIEQGPLLVDSGIPVGIVKGIRGTLRGRNCRTLGEYAHSGAVPRESRHDALFATAELAVALENEWERWLADQRDSVCTMGRFSTDPKRHSLTKVPGEVQFSIDFRTLEAPLLNEARTFLVDAATQISARRGVAIELGSLDISPPSLMDTRLQARLRECANALDIPAVMMASGAGHDAANFSEAGVPTAMIFVRNDHGSHNPHEAMDMADFSLGTRVLAEFLMSPSPW